MNENHPIDRRVLPIASLVPCNPRQVGQKHRERLRARLQAEGLLDLLVVYDRGNGYEILDGHLRYKILQELGETTIPCLVLKEVQNHDN